RLVEANRVNFSALVVPFDGQGNPTVERRATLTGNGQQHETQIKLPSGAKFQPVIYPDVGAKFYVGWPLQRLKKVALVEGGIVGQISAPALIELAGAGRDVRGWRIPSAALDACLFAVGILAWQQVAAGSALPVRMGQIKLGRLPSPGEACEVHARLRRCDAGTATFDFTLFGVDGATLVDVVDYQVAWLAQEQPTAAAASRASDAHSGHATQDHASQPPEQQLRERQPRESQPRELHSRERS
ncbi:MAG: polyketide synthase dehydratase domain-containing protein, partial [Planctomycetales bacterium]|nr:polyketide synthase dehydratase domain-containing protein [Planctomycetales bacterium]